MTHAAVSGDIRLQFFDFGPEDETLRSAHFFDGAHDRLLGVAVLQTEIEQRDGPLVSGSAVRNTSTTLVPDWRQIRPTLGIAADAEASPSVRIESAPARPGTS